MRLLLHLPLVKVKKQKGKNLDKNEKNEGEEERGSQGERKGEKKMRQ